jgi:hypothetical protein
MSHAAAEKSSGKGEAAGAIASASTGVAAAALTVVTAACCVSPVIAPIIVTVLGASGAVWAAGLKPYGWWILGAAFACLAFGFWTVYRPRRDCAVGTMPRQSGGWPTVAKVSLWFGAACWMAGVLLRLILPSTPNLP